MLRTFPGEATGEPVAQGQLVETQTEQVPTQMQSTRVVTDSSR